MEQYIHMDQGQVNEMIMKLSDVQQQLDNRFRELQTRERKIEDERRSLHSRELALASAMREYEGLIQQNG